MTIQELIDKLKTFPPETMVVVKGYEAGYNDIVHFNQITLKLDANDKFYYGQHALSEDLKGTKAIALIGENKNATEKVPFHEW